MREEDKLGIVMEELVNEKVSTIGVVDTLKWSVDRGLIIVVKHLIHHYNYSDDVILECISLSQETGNFGTRRFLEIVLNSMKDEII